MQSASTAKFVRYTPRKINQVLSVIRGKTVSSALEILSFTSKSPAILIEKVLKSAISNANALKDFSSYSVKEAWVGSAPILKRMRPGPRGTGMPIKKRTAHLTIVISDEIPLSIRKKNKAPSVVK
ncbi:MAG: 50S ribosomal protein L22 [Elusimicrobiota bacterium]|jgi:large subunit ribosomal protein L22|nr:50S ribosomal protein L22 [Elusimicrobiota bacterium]